MEFVLPTLTAELLFSLKHWQALDAICDDTIAGKFGKDFQKVGETVYHDKAGDAAEGRILLIAESINEKARRLVRIDWSNRRIAEHWGAYGSLFPPRGRKKMLGWLGVYFSAWRGDTALDSSCMAKGRGKRSTAAC